jgi:molybdopterin-binding protein
LRLAINPAPNFQSLHTTKRSRDHGQRLSAASVQKGIDTMKISARNALPGKIVEITKGSTTSHVRIDVKGIIVTASITNEAVDELKLKVGDDVHAVVKSSDVMVAVA